MAAYRLYGSALSPFSLKTRMLCSLAGLPVEWLPEEGGAAANLEVQARRWATVRGLRPVTDPPLSELDELPLVPFLFGRDGTTRWDSSAIGGWLQAVRAPGLLPRDPARRWLCRWLDEYVDEFGLYLLHHHRWVTCAATTGAPGQLRREFVSLLPGPLGELVVERFVARQVARLPYLFSVAPSGFRVEGLDETRQPPARDGFPPTHALLDDALSRLLLTLEEALSRRGFLFGDAPTLADASFYGMLASQVLLEPEIGARIAALSPSVGPWLSRMEGARLPEEPVPADRGRLRDDEPLFALFDESCRTFLPLMLQNAEAHRAFAPTGAGLRNERAFDRSRSLYRGEIDGHAFRSVAKTFQVKVWRTLMGDWARLPAAARGLLGARSPELAAAGERASR